MIFVFAIIYFSSKYIFKPPEEVKLIAEATRNSYNEIRKKKKHSYAEMHGVVRKEVLNYAKQHLVTGNYTERDIDDLTDAVIMHLDETYSPTK